MMEEKIKNWIREILKIDEDLVLVHPKDLKNGDYTFISSSKNPEADAETLRQAQGDLRRQIERIEVVGRFINFYLSRKFFADTIEEILNQGENAGRNKVLAGKKIMVEYTDPNPFKPFHIGHLMTNAIGESISRILEHAGADVARANYQGDVGLHVARAIWGLKQKGFPEFPVGVSTNAEKASFVGECYSFGAMAYEQDPKAKTEIDEINKKIYDESDKIINEIYEWGFEVTMDAFEDLYRILGSKFDYYFLESNVADTGVEIVKANIGKVFKESEGAVIFKAEDYDPKLHTRVFITSAGLPTYEAKELGLTIEKFKTEPNMDLCMVITANEQADYMRVVAKALSLIHPEYENKMLHITHGMMRFSSGKMGSRKGNVITGESLIRDTISAVLEKAKENVKENDWEQKEKEEMAQAVGVAAIKYSILKQSTGGDIIYDVEQSISLEGDSGPYLQYSYVRAKSALEKAQKENILPDFKNLPSETFEIEELLYKFPEIVHRAASEYEPHYITNYLIEVARSFNSFYGNNLIVDTKDPTSSYKVALTYAFTFVMKTGLHLLGIEAPGKM